MPVATEDSGQAAVQTVVDNLSDLSNSAGAQDTDLIFLRGLIDNKVVKSLVKVHDQLEDTKLQAVGNNNLDLVREVIDDIRPEVSSDDDAAELAGILSDPHFQSLLETHDRVAGSAYETPPSSPSAMPQQPASSPSPNFLPPFNGGSGPGEAIRMVGIRKGSDEPLGVTLKIENNELVIARILQGGMIDKQGLLHVGDIIKEVNGQDVSNNPEKLQEHLREAAGSVTLKILPSYQENASKEKTFIKAHFDYDPAQDKLVPCKEAAVAFKKGDILEVVDMEDSNWWQARRLDDDSPAGLIPSQQLEERRKAFVPADYNYVNTTVACGMVTKKRKRKIHYMTTRNTDFDRNDIQIYEEVARMPPFQRKSLVLIGAQGVGRRSLKNRLITSNPEHFGTVLPYTSRDPRESEVDGVGYHFVDKDTMLDDIKANKYLESGEYGDNLYGTRVDSITKIIQSGKMCILDVNPQCLKVLKSSEFMPFVVFVASPDLETLRQLHSEAEEQGSTTKHYTERDFQKTVEESRRINQAYNHYFDLTIVNDNIDEAYEKLGTAIGHLSTEPQWVPVNWVY